LLFHKSTTLHSKHAWGTHRGDTKNAQKFQIVPVALRSTVTNTRFLNLSKPRMKPLARSGAFTNAYEASLWFQFGNYYFQRPTYFTKSQSSAPLQKSITSKQWWK